jgi:hypothetical protein
MIFSWPGAVAVKEGDKTPASDGLACGLCWLAGVSIEVSVCIVRCPLSVLFKLFFSSCSFQAVFFKRMIFRLFVDERNARPIACYSFDPARFLRHPCSYIADGLHSPSTLLWLFFGPVAGLVKDQRLSRNIRQNVSRTPHFSG